MNIFPAALLRGCNSCSLGGMSVVAGIEISIRTIGSALVGAMLLSGWLVFTMLSLGKADRQRRDGATYLPVSPVVAPPIHSSVSSSPPPGPVFWDSEASASGKYRADSYIDPEAADDWYDQLFVTRLSDGRRVLVYHGDSHTSAWGWRAENLKLFYDCGTSCTAITTIPISARTFTPSFQAITTDSPGWRVRSSDVKNSPDGRYTGNSDTGHPLQPRNYFNLQIVERATGRIVEEVARDGLAYRWEWTPDNAIKIWRYCGQGCDTFEIVRFE